MEKPGYGTSKRSLWLSQVMAWLVILGVTTGGILGSEGALALATIVFPSMVSLIAVMLGIHRGLGSLDMKTLAGASSALKPLRPPGESP